MPQTGPSLKVQGPVRRLEGVDLKAAEHVTRRLLQTGMVPKYTHLPRAPPNVPGQIRAFLDGSEPFANLHPAVDPAWRGTDEASGRPYGVPPARSTRKRQQISAMVRAVLSILCEGHLGNGVCGGGRIMDLCGGCGHVGIVLAALLPAWEVVVVDAKPFALRVAKRRAEEAGLVNLKTREMDIGELGIEDRVDVAVALHACGDASDIVLDKAMRAGAAAVVAPCCVGGVVSAKPRGVAGVAPAAERGERWDVPRSAKYEAELAEDEYRLLVRAADFGDDVATGDGWRRAAKTIVEGDRKAWAEAMGYHVRLVKMEPISCTPKNDILVLWPWKWGEPSRGDDRPERAGQTSAGAGAEGKLSPPHTAEWDLNDDANLSVMAVIGRNGLLAGFDVTVVAAVDRQLRADVFAPESSGEFAYPPSQGARSRKIVHAVAGSLGMHHESVGTGPERHVIVKRSPQWPFFFRGYLGFGGLWVADVVGRLAPRVPVAHCAQRASARDNQAPHITLIPAREIKSLPNALKYNPEQLLSLAQKMLRGYPPRLVGLGRVVDEKDSENDVYFGIVDWPEAAAFRADVGLPPLDFHVTLGFAKRDIHGVCKDSSTLVAL